MIAQPQRTGVTVGYQGVPGSFSSQAMHQWFGQVESRNYPKFEDVFLALQNGAIDYGVVPMENSSTGAINDNYDLLNKYHFFIVGEQSIYIAQNLLGVKGAKLNDIKEVYSHPQGLLQTSQFLAAHQIQGKECLNTALAAKMAAERQDPAIGAIASTEAAKLYDLDVLAPSIENDKSNHTRFIIFGRAPEVLPDADRISLIFTLKNEVGTLYEVMRVIKEHAINMVRIESRPLLGNPWEYYFYVDLDGNLADPRITETLAELKNYTTSLRLLGNYHRQEN